MVFSRRLRSRNRSSNIFIWSSRAVTPAANFRRLPTVSRIMSLPRSAVVERGSRPMPSKGIRRTFGIARRQAVKLVEIAHRQEEGLVRAC